MVSLVQKSIMRLPQRYRVLPVMFGAVLIHISLGTYHTFGNMLPYMASYLRNRTDSSTTLGEMIWVPTMQGCFPFAMVIGGVLAHLIGPRLACALGCSLMSCGVFLSSFTIQHSVSSFFFTYGFMYGLGQGIAYVVAVATVINWAPDRVGLVSGIVAAGFGVSSSIFAPIQTHMVNPSNFATGKDGYFKEAELLDRVPGVFRSLGLTYMIMQAIGLIFITDPKDLPPSPSISSLIDCFPSSSYRRPSSFSSVRYSSLRNHNDDVIPLTAKVRHRSISRGSSSDGEEEEQRERSDSESSNDGENKKSMSPKEVLSSSTFYFLFCALFCCSFYANTFYNLYKTFAETFIDDDIFLAWAFSLGSMANAAARIAWGQMTDKTSFQTALSLACCMASFLLLTMPMTPLGGKTFFLIWLILLFTCMAATHALFITATVRCFGARYKATNYGLCVLSTTFSGIALSLLAQYELHYLGYNWLFLITSIFPFIAFGLSTTIQITPQGHRIAS
ncbi:hypothetical protein PFISCL1PPCAC_1965 [Pristionchus fissidentatus]|uniref:Membrane transporter n=1 Tax=Pristionchus fissidentatus TaxID=1538716 RepID=A0AAV5UVB6_9BILA|nr:hypothetical protein PFISCL1PPCAC_1965 [Pristionchus fissidentatus]